MALSEKSEFILCELKSSLFHDSSHRNGYITSLRSVCDAYHLFAIKVKVISLLISVQIQNIPTYALVCRTRAHHRDQIPERDVTYHLTCLFIYH